MTESFPWTEAGQLWTEDGERKEGETCRYPVSPFLWEVCKQGLHCEHHIQDTQQHLGKCTVNHPDKSYP